MRHLDTSAVSTTKGLPIKGGTWQHLQAAYGEAFDAVLKNLIGSTYDPTKGYILNGCINTGTGLNFAISAGAVFFNGEIYLVDAVTFTAAGGQTAVCSIVDTFFTAANADPVQFTDSVNRNVHKISKIVIASGVAGSTIADFANLIRIPSVSAVSKNVSALPSALTLSFLQDEINFYQSAPNDCAISFDATFAIPGAVKRLKWSYAAGRVLSFTLTSSQALIKDAGDLTSVGNATNLLYIMYVGKNENGKDEFSYTLKQV